MIAAGGIAITYIAQHGLQVLSSAMAINEGLMLNPKVNCIFFQIGNATSPLAVRDPSGRGDPT